MKMRWKKLIAGLMCSIVICTNTELEHILWAEAAENKNVFKEKQESETADVDKARNGYGAENDGSQESEEDMISVIEEEESVDADTKSTIEENSTSEAYTLTYEVMSDGTAVITGYEGTPSGDLVIPEEINGCSVTRIGGCAFYGCSGFTGNLTIPPSVTEIGLDAFEDCNGFTGSLIIPPSVTEIGDGAFRGCSGFTGNLTIPSSVTEIGGGAFGGCSGFTGSLTIPSSVTTIGSFAFADCSGFTGSLTISPSVTEINGGTFSGCNGFTGNLTIPSSVTIIHDEISLGEGAFEGCSGFTGNLTIPLGVTKIGSRAFSGCSGLTGNLTIPSSVTEIGVDAFEDCSGFTGNLTIPPSVTEIGYDAFSGCNGFTGSLIIPSSVTTINSFVFIACSGFTGNLDIPSSVTTIGSWAFMNCSGFTGSLDIPSSVTKIGEGAFSNCSRFTGSLTIPSSVTEIGDYAFNACNSLSSIQILNPECQIFDSSKTIAENIVIHGYADSTAQAYAEKYKRTFISLGAAPPSGGKTFCKTVVPYGKYQFHVVDQNGNSLSGVQVTYSKQSQKTDQNGLATFDLFTVGIPSVSAELNGYITWSNANSNWEKSDTNYEIIVLYEEYLGKYKLSSCRYSNWDNMSMSTDLLTKTKTVSLGNDSLLAWDLDNGKFYIDCRTNADSGVAHYELWQGERKIADATDGKFSGLSTDSFLEGSDCFIRVFTDTGETVDTVINLKFKKQEINKDTEMSFDGSSIKFKIADDIPYLGGYYCDFKMPVRLPVTYQVTDDKLQVGLNVELTEGKSKEDQLKEAKNLLRDVRKAGNLNVGKKLTKKQQKIFDSLTKNKDKWKFIKSIEDIEVNVLGYLEADLGSSTAKGNIMLQVKIDPVKYGYTTWVVVAPVTVNIELSLEAGVIGEVSFNCKDATLLGVVDINGSAELKAFGGIGVGAVMGAGAYGSAKLETLIRVLSLDTPRGFQSLELTGELGVKAYLGPLEHERPFAYNTWSIYSANAVRSFSSNSMEGWADGLYDADAYQIHDLGYLSEESEWMNTPVLYSRAATSGGLLPLLTDTYRNAQPVMAVGQDGIYVVFLRADMETGHVYTAITKYDGTHWADPVRVDDTAVMDGNPAVCVDEAGTVWLAYTRTAGGNGNNSLLDYAKSQSIVVGSVNPETLKFEEKKVYPAQGYVRLPQMALVNGTPTLVWADSDVTDDNSVLYPASNHLYAAVCENGVWSETEPLGEVNKPVSSVVIGEKEGVLAAAYTADEDGNYTTAEDQNLYCLMNGEHTLLAKGIQGRVKFGVLPGTDRADFIWNAGGRLITAGGAQVEAESISREYVLMNDRIYYSAAKEQGAQLVELLYIDGKWSLPVVLDTNKEGRYLENLSVVRWNGTDYVIGMNTLANITSDKVEDAKNLVWMTVGSVSNIKLEAIDYNTEGLVAGEEAQMTLTVTNISDHTVNNITARWNTQERVLPSEKTMDITLLPGETTDINLPLTCPSEVAEYTFTVSETGNVNQNNQDNTSTVSLGYPDLTVKLEERQIGQNRMLAAIITNEGVASASGRIQFSNASGNVLEESTFESLNAGDVLIITYSSQVKNGDYTATLLCDGEDLYTDNNIDTIHTGMGWTEESSKVKITGLAMADCVYTAVAVSPQGTVKAELTDGTDITDELTFTYVYKGTMADGSIYGPSVQPPVNAGSYTLTVSVVENDQGYSGTKEYPFTVGKAKLKITAENKIIRVGDALPEKYSCQTEGLLGNDVLKTEPFVTCAVESTSTVGEYRLIPSNADAGMNYDISYVEGKLSVSEEPDVRVYTVTFHMQGHGVAPEKYTAVQSGNMIKEPTVPTEDGYIFTGWYKDSVCTTLWDFAKDIVNGDLILYAGWKKIYTVTFNLQNKGSVLPEYTSAVYNGLEIGSTIKKPADPKADGYIFTGWYKEASCQNQWDFEKDTVEADITLYAGWIRESDYKGVLLGDILVAGDRDGFWVAEIQDQIYTGKAIKPDVHVYNQEQRLEEGRDYTLTCKNNIKALAAKLPRVTVKGKGNYTGTFTVTFMINKAELDESDLVYTPVYPKGKAYAPAVVKDGILLKAKTDYTVTYENNDTHAIAKKAPTKEGSYTMHVEGKGSCEGEIDVPYTVTAKDGSTSITKAKASVPAMIYRGDTPKPILRLKGNILREGTDYTVVYANTNAKGTATAVFAGKGAYSGVLKKTFKVKAAPIGDKDVTVSKSAVYQKSGAKPEISVIVDGDKLIMGVDYTVSYKNNKRAGRTATVTIKGKGNYSGKVSRTFQVTAEEAMPERAKINYFYDLSAIASL